jgi:hypothetical protein
MTDALFEVPDGARVEPGPTLSPDRRRTLRRAETLAAGYHPITGLRLHDQAAPADDRKAPGRRCGNCRFRAELLADGYKGRRVPKCLNPGSRSAAEIETLGPPYISHSAATDVPKWLPGCRDHSYGDPGVSEDAARWVPGAEMTA